MKEKIFLSLVIPVFNEEANIGDLFQEVRDAIAPLGRQWEAVFVDDGSTDDSLARLRELAAVHPEVRYLSFAENRGQSAGFAAGFQVARGTYIITMDADLQNDPQDIPAMLATMDTGYDMVAGWRAKRRDTWAKRWASLFANRVRNLVSGETVRDTGCSLKVMRADMARHIPMFKGMHRFLPTLMRLQGARVMEVEVRHRPRRHGHSKYGIWDRALSSALDLLAVRWMQSRHIDYTIKERN